MASPPTEFDSNDGVTPAVIARASKNPKTNHCAIAIDAVSDNAYAISASNWNNLSDGNLGVGVSGFSLDGVGVYAVVRDIAPNTLPTESVAVWAHGADRKAIFAVSSTNTGVEGKSDQAGTGVHGHSKDGIGIQGESENNTGAYASGAIIGLFAESPNVGGQFHCTTAQPVRRMLAPPGGFHVNEVYLSEPGLAAWFNGDIHVVGDIIKYGTNKFKIDHPLDPSRKYLSHAVVESPDMKNIYDGIVVLDANGEAKVELPAWFEALNTEFRYQLTCIGGYAPVYITQEIQGNRFGIAGGVPGLKVSWQVTGIRQDTWAKAHSMQVEEDKPIEEHGYYLHPELHGEPEEKSVTHVRHPHPLPTPSERPTMPRQP